MKKTNLTMQTLTASDVLAVSGGSLLFKTVLHGAHIIELYNKIAGWVENGCSNIEPGDYFTKHACGAIDLFNEHVIVKRTSPANEKEL